MPWEPSSRAACRRLRSKFRSRIGRSPTARLSWKAMCGDGRPSAWPQPPSGLPTSWFPANGRATSSPWPERYIRCPQPRQRPRVEQFGKWETARNAVRRCDARCARGSFFGGSGRESTAPGAASAARAGVSRLVLLGDPPSFDEDVSDPHCCVKPFDAVAVPSLAATRGASFPTLAAGLLFGDDGVVVPVFSLPHDRDPSLVPAIASLATTVQASIKDLPCPVVPRESSEGLARPPPAACLDVPAIRFLNDRMVHPFDSPPSPFSRVAHPCPMPAHLPGDSRMR